MPTGATPGSGDPGLSLRRYSESWPCTRRFVNGKSVEIRSKSHRPLLSRQVVLVPDRDRVVEKRAHEP
ncbi:hypothetical protein, partial [Ferrimicrobium acidiphilum]|uniref:hypothetical protein n=1 Tax=Ferrimicrobium acidiphilum TaxID=121039 RepID=UPI0023F29343